MPSSLQIAHSAAPYLHSGAKMKVIAAYLLAVLGGNAAPSADDLRLILGSGTTFFPSYYFLQICFRWYIVKFLPIWILRWIADVQLEQTRMTAISVTSCPKSRARTSRSLSPQVGKSWPQCLPAVAPPFPWPPPPEVELLLRQPPNRRRRKRWKRRRNLMT